MLLNSTLRLSQTSTSRRQAPPARDTLENRPAGKPPARKTSGEPPCPLVAVATVFGRPPLDEDLPGPPSVRRCTIDDADGLIGAVQPTPGRQAHASCWPLVEPPAQAILKEPGHPCGQKSCHRGSSRIALVCGYRRTGASWRRVFGRGVAGRHLAKKNAAAERSSRMASVFADIAGQGLLGVCLNNGSLTLVSWVIPIPTPSLVSP